MAVTLSDPFETLFNLQQTLDAFRASNWLDASPSAGGSYPPVNVFRKGDDYVVITELPGIAKSDLDIQVKGNKLRISGAKTIDYGDKASLHRRERLSGTFDRTVALPVAIEAEQVKAECRDGVLAVYLPCDERDKPRAIKVA
jgi:HSP20 family protein